MAAQLTQMPPVIALSKNAMPVQLTTDKIATDQPFVLISVVNTTGVSVGDTLTIGYNQVLHIFSFVATPNTSGTELPLPEAGQTPEAWGQALAERLRMYAPLSDDFLIQDTPLSIKLNWRTFSPLVIITASTTATAFTTTAHSVARIVLEDNLFAKISVHHATTHETLLVLNGSYDMQTRQCAFDIRPAFGDIRPTLPNEYEADPSTIFIGEQRAFHSLQKYYVRYADAYGAPPKPELQQRSMDFTVIQGGVASGRVTDFFFHHLVPLHNYSAPELGVPFTKSVTREQPDWVYFVCPNAQMGLQMEYAVTYSSGEERFFQDGTFNATAQEVRIIPTGFKQFSLRHFITNRNDGDIFPVSYEFRIRLSDGTTALRLTYELELFAAWNMYILLDNGIGGMESVRLKGKKTKTYEGDATIIEKNNGEMSSIFPQGFTRWEASTGWYEDYQAEHLAQLLLGQIWLIDPSDPLNPTFTPVIAEKQSFNYENDDEDKGMVALTFKFRTAKTETQSNRF
jgi:hypothetical protein